jgi:hypothetical protein
VWIVIVGMYGGTWFVMTYSVNATMFYEPDTWSIYWNYAYTPPPQFVLSMNLANDYTILLALTFYVLTVWQLKKIVSAHTNASTVSSSTQHKSNGTAAAQLTYGDRYREVGVGANLVCMGLGHGLIPAMVDVVGKRRANVSVR